MAELAKIAAWSVYAFAALLFVAQLVAHEIGYRIGLAHTAKRETAGEGIGILVGSLLGLLAFVLALTLSFANNRFNDRRLGTLAEANAIGTAWLRAKAIGQPRGDEIARLLEQYTSLRRTFVGAPQDRSVIDGLNNQTNALQSAIWAELSLLVREQPGVVSVSLMTSLNEVFDMTTAERFAFELRLPSQIFWLLIGLTLLGMAALGYQLSVRGARIRVLAALLALTWTVVIVDILDLTAPRIGDFRTGTAVYDWTLQGFHLTNPAPAK